MNHNNWPIKIAERNSCFEEYNLSPDRLVVVKFRFDIARIGRKFWVCVFAQNLGQMSKFWNYLFGSVRKISSQIIASAIFGFVQLYNFFFQFFETASFKKLR